MAHRTQLYLDDSQYQFVKDLARAERKSIAQLFREWIEERRHLRAQKRYEKDPFWQMRGIGASGRSDIAKHFDDYLYGDKR
ncbi:MAG: hypothetical protein HYV03_05295 [Deltaproteobacteria bacterium]|nr:hypothetical protein [Deltaproteobacteria bacterium]